MPHTPEDPLSAHGVSNPLEATDAEMARITEDLVNVLIERGVIQFTDLPQEAQAKLMSRARTRTDWKGKLTLIDDNASDTGVI